MKTLSITSSLVMLWGATFACESFAQATYARQHDVLVDAIKRGSTKGVMVGEVAEQFTRELRSTGALLVSAKVIASLPRPDCKRVEVTYTKKNVPTPKGTTDAIMKMQVNYCLDGSPPVPAKEP